MITSIKAKFNIGEKTANIDDYGVHMIIITDSAIL